MESVARIYILGLRPWFWLAAVGPSLAGYLFVADTLNWLDIAFLIFLLGFGIGGFSEFINEISDSKYDTHQQSKSALGINSSGNVGILNTASSRKRATLLAGLHVAVVLAVNWWWYNGMIFALACMGFFIAWAYSAKPLRLKRHYSTNLLAKLVGYGFISFHLGIYLGSGDLSATTITLALLIGLVQIGYIGIADLDDTDIDAKNGLLTLPVEWGVRTAAQAFMFLSIAGLLALSVYTFTIVGSVSNPVLFFGIVCVLATSLLIAGRVVLVVDHERYSELAALHLLAGVVMMLAIISLFVTQYLYG